MGAGSIGPGSIDLRQPALRRCEILGVQLSSDGSLLVLGQKNARPFKLVRVRSDIAYFYFRVTRFAAHQDSAASSSGVNLNRRPED